MFPVTYDGVETSNSVVDYKLLHDNPLNWNQQKCLPSEQYIILIKMLGKNTAKIRTTVN